MSSKKSDQLSLIQVNDSTRGAESDALTIKTAFDPRRLTQARRIAAWPKRKVAIEIGVSPAAVGQWEAGTSTPRPDHIESLADFLDVPVAFFSVGRPHARLDAGSAHFRSLRSTPAMQRERAAAYVEQVWELTYALEKKVQFPSVDLPERSSEAGTTDPIGAARELRRHWQLGTGPIPHLVRTMEGHGIIVTLVNFAGSETAKIDAFSTSDLPRPVVVLTPDRADDVYRHRFTAAHELGHLLLHSETDSGDPLQEREADAFAAEFLTPRIQITSALPRRMDFQALSELSQIWGVAVDSLVYRCREVQAVSEASYRRAYQRLAQLRKLGLFQAEPVEQFPGEIPILLRRALSIAEDNGLTQTQLANEIRINLPRLRLLLGIEDRRPKLSLV